MIKLKIVKFSKNIALEVLKFDPILNNYRNGYFNVINGLVTFDSNIGNIDSNNTNFFISFDSGGTSVYGGRGWYLKLDTINKIMMSSSNLEDVDNQFNKMTKSLSLVIEYIKENNR